MSLKFEPNEMGVNYIAIRDGDNVIGAIRKYVYDKNWVLIQYTMFNLWQLRQIVKYMRGMPK